MSNPYIVGSYLLEIGFLLAANPLQTALAGIVVILLCVSLLFLTAENKVRE